MSNDRKLSKKNYLEKFESYKEILNFVISIEGTKLIHDNITNINGSFYESLSGLRNCIELGFITTCNITLCRKNFNNIYNLILELIPTGILNISLNYGTPILNSYYNRSHFLELSEINKVIKDIENFIKNDDIFFFITTPLPFCIFDSEIKELIFTGNIKINTICHILNGQGITVDFNGNILPCTHFVDLPIANINQFSNSESFSNFWDNSFEKNFRKKIRKFPSQICNNCDYSDFCTGGCPIIWSYNNTQILRNFYNASI